MCLNEESLVGIKVGFLLSKVRPHQCKSHSDKGCIEPWNILRIVYFRLSSVELFQFS